MIALDLVLIVLVYLENSTLGSNAIRYRSLSN